MRRPSVCKTFTLVVFCLLCVIMVTLITYMCTITWIRMSESKRARFYFGEYAYESGIEDRIEELWKSTMYKLLWKVVYDWQSFEYNAKLLDTLAKADNEALKGCKESKMPVEEAEDTLDEQQFCLGYLNSTLMKKVVDDGIQLCKVYGKNVTEEILFIGNGKSELITRQVECVPYVLGRVTSFTHADRITQCAEKKKHIWDCARKYCSRWFSADK